MCSVFYVPRNLSVLFLFLLSMGARANNFYVTNLGDAGAGSLRQAITDVNNTTTGLPHTIVFNVSGQIVVQTSLPQISSAGLTIDGVSRITLNTPGGDVGINFFTIAANNVTVRNFTLLNTGGTCVVVQANTSDVTVQNIVANNFNGAYINQIVNVAGASNNLTLKNIRSWIGMQNFGGTAYSIFFNGGRQTGLKLDSINLGTSVSSGTAINGLYFNNTPINGLTITNSRLAGMTNGIYFAGPAADTSVVMNNITVDSLWGGGYAFYSGMVTNNLTLRRALFNVNQGAAYGIAFANAGKFITIDSLTVHGSSTYGCWFSGGVDSNIVINHSTFDNFKGSTNNQAVRFDQPVTGLTMIKDSIDETITGSAVSGGYGILFSGAATNVLMDSVTINKASTTGIWIASSVNGFTLNHSRLTANGIAVNMFGSAAHANVRVLNSSFLNSTTASSGAFQYNAATLPEQFRFQNDTVAYNAASGLRAYGGSFNITDTITDCVIHDNTAYGVLMDASPTGVVITNNSIYNNNSGGIGMTSNGNCGYNTTGKIPVIVSSAAQGGGSWQLRITAPNVVAGATYSLDIYANDAGVSAGSGQYYVTTINNVTYNNNIPTAYIVNYNKGVGLTGRGFWTATLRIPADPCGTSAFSNPLPMVARGPASVSNGIVGWYRADMAASGTNWGDVSGMANNLVLGAGTPAVGVGMVNFNPAFYYNGSSGHIVPSTAAVSGAYTLGGMSRMEGTQSARVFSSQGSNKLFGWFGGRENALYVEAWLANGTAITKNSHLYSFERSTSPAPAYEFRGDGHSLLSGGSTDAGAWTLSIGYSAWGGEYSKVYIPEVYIYNRDITAAEMKKVESYMGLKYGLTLDSGKVNYVATDGNPYWTASGNYKYRITGVGRDSITDLYQKQSLSQDTGVVTIALGPVIDTSNAANPSVIAADKSFFVFADNGGVTRLSTTLTATGLKSTLRMGRVWMVQKTANWADQSITLRIAGAGPNNYLLISTDNVFGSVGQELKLDAGGNVTLNSSLLSNGTYFTIGGNIGGPGNVNTGIALWLRADDGQSTGALWNDYSGNLNAASQPTAANQASVVQGAFNFNRGLRFNGTTNNLTVPYNAAFNGNVTVYTVYNQLNAGNVQTPICSRNSSTALGWNLHIDYTNSNRRGWYTAYGGNYDIQTYGNYTNKQPEMIGLMATPGSGTASKNMYLNGSPLLATPTTTSRYSSNTTTPLYIGSVDGGAYPWNGDIAEAIVYSRVLSATERQQVESYLALKYGITLNGGGTSYLASDGTTKFWDITVNPGYVKHVTGIGRDSATGLYQKQSLGVDTGYVTLALGPTVAKANELNAAIISADKSFFVAGDNGGSKSFVNNVITSGATFVTLGRAWKVQKTNWTDGNLTLATDTTLPLPQDLLISTDPTFGTGVTVLPLSRGVVTLNSSQLANGAYFTFADTLRAPGGVNTGIGAWWRADAGGSVSAWPDYSGNGRTQTQTTVSNQPTLQPSVINFNPVLSFNGSNNYMTSPSVFGTGSIQYSSYFTVALTANGSDAAFGEVVSGGGGIRGYIPYSGGTITFDAPYSPYRISGAWGGTYGNPYLFALTRSPFPTSMDASVNNRSVASNSSALTNYTGTNQPFYLGAQSTVYFYKGQIAEMVVYNNTATMTATDRQKIMSYLAFKYGITLNPMPANGYRASDGTPFWGDATNSGYPFHITGVGRDSTSGLYQRQSVSADTGLVTLALGDTVATSNAVNGATIGVDRSFFVFSDNGGAITYLTGLSGVPGFSNRMGRVFKVQKTSWTDQKITMKVRGATSKTYLLVSTDQTFASGVTAYAFSDSTIHVNTSVLAGGAYFTFARQTPAPNAVANGLVFWLRADDGSVSGTQWNDYTGNGQNAVQAIPANQPVLDAKAINFNYGLQFNNNTGMQAPASAIQGLFPFGNTDRTIISVAAQTVNSSGWQMSYGSVANGAANGLAVFASGLPSFWGYYADINGPAGSYPLNKPMLLSGSHTAAGSPNTYLYVNGARNASGNPANTWNTDPTRPVNLGQDPNGTNRWNGPISELIVYNRALSAIDSQKVYSYLALKYGLTLNTGAVSYLASDGSPYWTANATTYRNRITGIGRDDSTKLYTKQSLSADTGLVTLALGSSIALTNQTNTGTIPNDRSFFVFADNGLSAGNFTAPLSGSSHGVTLRYARVWTVQKTNWSDQNITFKAPVVGINNYLLISSDPNFGSLTQEVPVKSDSTVTFSSSLLSGGMYFTFGAPILAPGGIGGHSLWLRADIGTSTPTNGAAVSKWNDQGSFANNVSQSTPANQPVYSDNATDDINFNPVLKFNGSNSFLTGGSILKTGTYTGSAAFVVNSEVSPTNSSIFNEQCTGGQLNLHATWSDNAVYWDGASNNRISFNVGNINNLVNLWTGSSDITLASNKQQIYRNGLSLVTGNGANTYAGSNSALWIGSYSGASSAYNGRIPEIVIYTSALTATQQQQVNSYMAIKYGLTLNNGQTDYLATDGVTKIWSADAIYKNSITGIGQDSVEALHQLQSRNSDTTRLRIAVGLGEIDSTNSANHNQFSADRSYMIWGDDNGPAGFQTAISGLAGLDFRMTRTWKVQETGSVGSVQVAIPFTSVPNPKGTVLLVSNTGVFDAGSTVYPLNQVVIIAGVRHYAVTLNFTNGQYFSFAANIKAPGGVPGTSLWLRPDQGTSSTVDGTKLFAWTDYGNQVNTAMQNNIANQPAYFNNASSNVNFNPMVQFTAANAQAMNLDVTKLPTGTTARTIFGTSKRSTTPSSYEYLITWGAVANSQGTGMGSNGGTGYFFGYNSDMQTTAGNVWQGGVFGEQMNAWSGAAGGNIASIYSKGLALAPSPQTYASWNTGTASALLGGSYWAPGSQFWNGSVGDVIVFGRQLRPGEIQRVETYLAIRYGYTMDQTTATNYLASDSTKIWDANANVAYKSGITGIGYDTTEGLLQLQSRNSDTTRLRIAVGLGGIDSVNSANLNSFGADRSYLIWGDDNGPAGFLTAMSGLGGVNNRMNRAWKVQVTGSVGSVQVAIPFSAVPNPTGAVLLVSNTGTFDATSTVYPLKQVVTIAGVKHYAATVNFTDGQYFSFAANIKAPGGVSGTSLWLRPDQGTSSAVDGTKLNAWTDYGNQVNTATQNTTANQPVYFNNGTSNVNFNPMVQFANNQTMNLDVTKLPTGTGTRTIFGTSKRSTTPSGYESLISWGAAASYQGAGLGSNSGAGLFFGYNNDMQTTASNVWQMGVVNEQMNTWSGAAGGNIASIYSKGLALAPSPQTYASWNTGTASALLGGSYWTPGSQFWNGSIGDVIVYGRQLRPGEIQRVETYLAIRYGYTMDQTTAKSYLASDSTTIWDASGNAAYKNGVTGIGSDTAEGLLQLQSRNSDTTRLRIAVGLGEIDSVNSANLNRFGADKSYLVWGDDNGLAGFLTAVSGITGVNYRMNRTWKAQVTGSVGSVQIAVPFSALPSTRTAVLLVSNTGVFDATSTAYPLNQTVLIGGVRHYAATIGLSNGQFFSFAANIKAPGGVAGTTLWLRADRGSSSTSDGAAVNTWVDYGNQVNTVTQTNVANQPAYADNGTDDINFNPVMKFNGTGAYLTGASMLKTNSSNGAAAFVVGNAASLTNSAVFHEGLSSNYFDFQVPWSNGSVTWVVNSGISYTPGTMTNQSMLWTGTYDGTLTSNNLGLFQNGLLRTTGSYTGNYTGNNSPLYIGEFPGSGFYNGRIPEIVVYNSALTATQQQQVNSYLAIKYGITLNNGQSNYLATDGTTTIWNIDANYKNSITGIGRDSSESLLQKQSRNSDTTRLRIAVGLGEIDSTNSANPNNFTADRSYLVWGDDNGLAGFLTAINGITGINYRMNRTWKVQVTGSVGNVQIAIPFSALPDPAGAVLLVSNTNVFDAGSTAYPLNQTVLIGGVKHHAATVNLTNGQYFSFAANVKAPGGVGGTALWLRADRGSSSSKDGALVNTWADYGNQANAVTQTNAANQPVYADNGIDDINFNPVMKFNGNNLYFSGPSLLKANTFTGDAAFTVNSQAAIGSAPAIFYENTTSYYFNMEITNGAGNVYWNTPYITTYVNYTPPSINGTVNLWTGSNNTALTSNRQVLYRNDSIVVTGNSATTMTGNNSTLYIGRFGTTAGGYNGRIPELAIYTSALTATQQQQVNSYLALKYGISLNQATPYDYLATDGVTKVWDATANAAYKYGITGIGRDSVEGLLQLQSRNSDTTRLRIAIGLGEIDSTNSANYNNFGADKSYLAWGDDNGLAGFQTAVSGVTGINFRMNRTWKAQVTGSVGSVQIAIPFIAVPSPQSAVLLVSNTGVFDATSTAYPLNQTVLIGGVRHYAATISLSNGQYFSFATNIKAPGGVAGTTLWLRADRGSSSTSDGAAVNTWVDYGNPVNTVTQTNAANQPVYADNGTDDINFNPVMKFNGSSTSFTGASMLKTGTYTGAAAFVVNSQISAASSNMFYESSTAGQFNLHATFSDNSVYWDPAFNNRISAAVGNINNLVNFWTCTSNITLPSNKQQIYRNGLSLVTGNNANTYTGNNSPLYIGSTTSSTSYNGRIPEMVVYTSALTATQQQQVNSYMAIKYGITLNNGQSNYVATDGTTNIWTADPTYKYSITGIGQDTTEGLLQLQSRNSDTTRLRIVVGLGEIDSTNSANPNNFAADKTYLVWGDDNGTTTFQTPVSGYPAANYRMGRTWKAQVTGSVGSVMLAFPDNVVSNPAQSYLVVSSDLVFDGTDTYIPLTNMTINGTTYWMANTSFTGTQYFTVAAFIKSPGGVGPARLWLRPDKGIAGATDGLAVPVWADFANPANSANQTNILNQPAYRQKAAYNINFNPVVTFTSSASQYMNLDVTKLPTGTNARTIFGMGSQSVAPSTYEYIISWGPAAGSQGSALASVNPQGLGGFIGYGDDVNTNITIWQAGVFNEQMNTWAGTGGNASIYSKNALVGGPTPKNWNTGATAATIGCTSWSKDQFWNGTVGDIIVFDRQLGATEMQRVETYLGIRYGYTLDQATATSYLNTNSTPVWNAGANAAYKYNIAGIGRDDVEGLNQLQSRSVNAGSILTIGLGGIAEDNPSNTGAFDSDTSYVIWGSNSVSTTTQTTNLPATGYSNTQRMAQQWKIAETNFDANQQPLSVAFDLTGFTYSDTGPNNLVLLIDGDGDGDLTTGTVQRIPSTSYDGATRTVRFDNVTALTDGAVFTLAFNKNNLQLNAKVLLQGAWNGTSMSTALKDNGLLPATDPYGLNTTPSVNPNSAAAPVVDWVRVELRDPATPTTVIASRAALLLADGSIVDTNYAQPLNFQVPAGSYYVAVRHRNHLGIMTAAALDLSSGSATVDFTLVTTPTYTRSNPAQTVLGNGVSAMWGGDANGDGKIMYTGAGSDADWILGNQLGGDANGYQFAYLPGDVNLDGQVYYISSDNDADWILYYPLGGNPNGVILAQLP